MIAYTIRSDENRSSSIVRVLVARKLSPKLCLKVHTIPDMIFQCWIKIGEIPLDTRKLFNNFFTQ